MIRIKQPKTLKNRLSIYFTMVIIIPAILISLFYYYYSTNALKKNMVANANSNVSYIMFNIDKQLNIATKLSDWIFVNKTMENVLTNNNLKQEELYNMIIRDKQILENTMTNSPIGKHISTIIISGQNGTEMITGDDAIQIDMEELKIKSWFKNGIKKNGAVYWSGIEDNPNLYDGNKYIIPIVRPIISSPSGKSIGWSYIAFKESLISEVFKEFDVARGNSLYIVDGNGMCISSTEKARIGKSMEDENYIELLQKPGKEYFNAKINDKEKLVVFYKSTLTGWTIVETLSYTPLYEQKRVLLETILVILSSSIFVTLIFSMFLSSNLTYPLKRILKKMRSISKGNFDSDPSLEGDDEMGELGMGINKMMKDISELLSKVKEEETEKKNLELMVLQNQVNPHFLYNTLNSIKWMATVQKADGIRDMVSCLARLLMNITKGAASDITLREEISLTEDYIFIQNMRYNGKIKVSYIIPNEDLLNNKIIKFTLQPIVENAIFHGIEPKKDAGNISIGIIEEEESLVIFVEDDGVGMEKQQIDEMFSEKQKQRTRGLSGIGIKNVDERIKITYGADFGVSIESVLNEFTRVYVKIPKEILAGDTIV